MKPRLVMAVLSTVTFIVRALGQGSVEPRRPDSASHPQPRTDSNSLLAHQQLVQKAQQGGIDVYFVGDSTTRRWGAADPQYRALLVNWKTNFFGWNAGPHAKADHAPPPTGDPSALGPSRNR